MMGLLAVQPGVPAGIKFMRKEMRQGLVGILDACEKIKLGECCAVREGCMPEWDSSRRMRGRLWTVS